MHKYDAGVWVPSDSTLTARLAKYLAYISAVVLLLAAVGITYLAWYASYGANKRILITIFNLILYLGTASLVTSAYLNIFRSPLPWILLKKRYIVMGFGLLSLMWAWMLHLSL